MSDHRTDHRLGRLVRLRDPNAACLSTARWLDGITTAIDEVLTHGGQMSRKYFVCLGAFASSDDALSHFCEMEALGLVVPCITDPVDLAELERSGDVMYVDDLPHPALFPDWREEDGHRLVSLVGMILRQKEMTMHRFESASVLAVARRNAAEQERRRLQVVVAVVAGLRSSPFYVVLPHAPSRHALDEMCLRALAPTTSRLAMHPNSDVAVEVGRTTVGMRDVARASEVYEADVAMFLLELAFVKTWALRTHGSVPAAREAARGEEEEEEAGAGRGAVAKTGVRADASVAWSSSAAKWMRDATALSRFDRGVRDAIRDCLLR